jgi:hypothetical protein
MAGRYAVQATVTDDGGTRASARGSAEVGADPAFVEVAVDEKPR